MLLGTLGENVLDNMLADEGVIMAGMACTELDRIFNTASSFD